MVKNDPKLSKDSADISKEQQEDELEKQPRSLVLKLELLRPQRVNPLVSMGSKNGYSVQN